jgi:UDP-N-acetylglucosamine--N-acetylmuramyl-(pentapeptide) pyrophosphoryl-undecaprenol N-acetylglucosamine transferase
MTTPVLFAGGGTAGHVFPAIAVARALTSLGDYEPVFVGTEGRLEARLVPEAGFRLETIDALPLPRKLSSGLFKLPFGLRRSVRQVRDLIEELQPAAAASFGGYVSFPLSRAAWLTDVPLLLHEQNAVPGLANQLAARWAHTVALTFPSSAPYFRSSRHHVVTGNPVRDEILHLDREAEREGARRRFDLEVGPPTILAFGGSQGARSLNRAVARAAPAWAEAGVQVIHAAGENLHAETVDMWREAVGDDPDAGPTVRILDFIDDMAVAYAAADIVVCRAGATSISELTALGLPSVLVPYPSATRDHQLANARSLARVGGARVIEDDRLTAASLVDAVRGWLEDPETLASAAGHAAAFGRRDASTLVAAAIHQVVEPVASAPGLVTDVRHPGTAELPAIDDDAFEAAFEGTTEAGERVETALAAAIDANELADERASDDDAATDSGPADDPDADRDDTGDRR